MPMKKNKFDDILGSNSKLLNKTAEDSELTNEAITGITNIAEPIAIPIDDIIINANQPRKYFDEEELAKLKESINEYGLLQPLVVYYNREESDKAILIAGERRYRACKDLGYATIPVYFIKDKTKIEELALIENVQREDLSAVERADAVCKLMVEKNYTYEAIARIIGKSVDTVRALEKVAKLPDHIKEESRRKKISLRELIKIERIDDVAEQEKTFGVLKKKYPVTEEDSLKVVAKREARKKDTREIVIKTINKLSKELEEIQDNDYLAIEKDVNRLIEILNGINTKFKK